MSYPICTGPTHVNGDQVLARLAVCPALPASFVRRVTELPPGATVAFDPVDWRGAVVVVRDGVVRLTLRSGVEQEFVARDVLWLAGLDVLHLPRPARARPPARRPAARTRAGRARSRTGTGA